MPQAARVTDPTAHGAPLNPGPGSGNVRIGGAPAWRAVPSGPLGASIEAASAASNAIMSAALLNPAAAAASLAQLQVNLQKAGVDAAALGEPSAASAASSAASGLTATSAGLAAAWAAAAAAPGGEPGASQAYTKMLQAAVLSAAGAVFSSMGGMTDLHNCPAPCPAGPHGPGVATRGSPSVFINGLPACREGDKVFEAAGGSNPIARGLATVIIGDGG